MKTTSLTRRAASHSIENLEQRIAPAVFVSPNVVTYSDHDGDDVTIRISKPLFTAGNIANVFQFINDPARLDGPTPSPARTGLEGPRISSSCFL